MYRVCVCVCLSCLRDLAGGVKCEGGQWKTLYVCVYLAGWSRAAIASSATQMDLSSEGQSQTQTYLSGTMLHSVCLPIQKNSPVVKLQICGFLSQHTSLSLPDRPSLNPPEPFPSLVKWTLFPFAAAGHKRGHEVCTQLKRMWPADHDDTDGQATLTKINSLLSLDTKMHNLRTVLILFPGQ